MFILQEKVGGKFRNVSGKFQYGQAIHAQHRAEKLYGGKLFWEMTGLSRTFEYGKDAKGKIWYQILIVSSNPKMKQHWIATVTQLANRRVDQTAYFDGSMTAAKKYFKNLPAINRHWGKIGYVISMQPNAIVLWDGWTKDYGYNPKVRQKKATKVSQDNGMTVTLYQTDIVKVLPNGDIQLNSGGHKTATTKRRMNEVADEFELYFKVFAKGGVWYISTEDRLEPPQTFEFYDGIIFSGPQHLRNPTRRKTMRKKKRSAKQLANDRRLGRMAKARAKAKRGGRRKTRKNPCNYGRKKVARRNPHRKTKAKSHLWIVFQCAGNKVRFMKMLQTGKIGFTSDKGKSLLFRTKKDAKFAADGGKILRGWNLGFTSTDTTKAQIIAHCAGKV